MSLEIDILYLFTYKEYYYNYNKYINKDFINRESVAVTLSLDNYYLTTGKEEIDWSEFEKWFFSVYKPSLGETERRPYEAVFDSLQEKQEKGEVPNPQVLSLLALRDLGASLYDVAFRLQEGSLNSSEPVSGLLDRYSEQVARLGIEDEAEEMDEEQELLSSLEDFSAVSSGLRWRLTELNKSIGPINTGDLLCLGGRPDSGKTTMLASEATYMAKQLPEDKYVLWVNNEERKSKVYRRIISAALGKDRNSIQKMDPEDVKREYTAAIGSMDKIRVKDGASISFSDVDKMMKSGEVGLLVIDQIYDLKGAVANSNTLEAEQLRQGVRKAREWAKDYCPVIFTVWADGSAEGERWINQQQIYGNKTGLQGGVDAIIAIGRSNEEPSISDRDNRYIHIPKNKCEFGEDETLRNGKFVVKIQPTKARFIS